MSKELKKVGFWWRSDFGHLAEYANLPKAQDFIDPTWSKAERDVVIAHLESGDEAGSYRGMSQCRICGCLNGSSELTDGTYLWPSGLTHYVEEHDLKPPQDFVDHIIRGGCKR